MDADWQPLLIGGPQVLKDQLGKAPGIAENQRCPVGLDQIIDFPHRMATAVAGPGNAAIRVQYANLRRGPRVAEHQPHRTRIGVGGDPPLKGLRIANGRRQPDPAQIGCQLLQAGKGEGQQITALASGERMHFVYDHRFDRGEQPVGIRIGNQQGQRFRCGQQDMRWPDPLPCLPVRWCVAGAGFDPDRQSHLRHRAEQVALHVDGQRL